MFSLLSLKQQRMSVFRTAEAVIAAMPKTMIGSSIRQRRVYPTMYVNFLGCSGNEDFITNVEVEKITKRHKTIEVTIIVTEFISSDHKPPVFFERIQLPIKGLTAEYVSAAVRRVTSKYKPARYVSHYA